MLGTAGGIVRTRIHNLGIATVNKQLDASVMLTDEGVSKRVKTFFLTYYSEDERNKMSEASAELIMNRMAELSYKDDEVRELLADLGTLRSSEESVKDFLRDVLVDYCGSRFTASTRELAFA